MCSMLDDKIYFKNQFLHDRWQIFVGRFYWLTKSANCIDHLTSPLVLLFLSNSILVQNFLITLLHRRSIQFNILNSLELDEMGQRIDDLEKNIAELMTQAGVEEK